MSTSKTTTRATNKFQIFQVKKIKNKILGIKSNNDLYNKISEFRKKVLKKSDIKTIEEIIELPEPTEKSILRQKNLRTKKKKNPNLKVASQAEEDEDSLSEGEARQIRIYDNLADYSEFLSRLTKDDDDLDVIYEDLKKSG